MPKISAEEYSLEVEGIGIDGTKTLSLNDLKTKFPKVTITAALQCAGNRRSEQNKVRFIITLLQKVTETPELVSKT